MKYSLVLLCLGLVSGQMVEPEPPSCGFGCMNGAECVWPGYGNKYICNCPADYTGKFCENQRQLCASGGESCVNGACLIIDDFSYCECSGTKYSGDLCEIETGCSMEGCQNGGECIDVMNMCNCTAGYTGDHCEIPILPCDSCSPYYTCEYQPCECQGLRDCENPVKMETPCYVCDGPEYGDCHLNLWVNTTMCEWGCVSRTYTTKDGMWFEHGCATDACWNGCYEEEEEDGMMNCIECCYDGYCNYGFPYPDVRDDGGRPGTSVVGASLVACMLLAIILS